MNFTSLNHLCTHTHTFKHTYSHSVLFLQAGLGVVLSKRLNGSVDCLCQFCVPVTLHGVWVMSLQEIMVATFSLFFCLECITKSLDNNAM